ncbi:hypothetical protein [Brucella pseudintermedia]|uniref:hypothetical protein n=1 Tax=Brucella pseudintermedia TaxID=370111 RepID=UPI0015894FD8|nr:hypothetical protein [Brucella pseudintermedia]
MGDLAAGLVVAMAKTALCMMFGCQHCHASMNSTGNARSFQLPIHDENLRESGDAERPFGTDIDHQKARHWWTFYSMSAFRQSYVNSPKPELSVPK